MRLCELSGCDNVYMAHGLCRRHYQNATYRWRMHKGTCKFCSTPVIATSKSGCCVKHRPAPSIETKKKISESRIGEKNPRWKGEQAGLSAIHGWLKRRYPRSELCEDCGVSPAQDLANISQEYKREIEDYEWLCRKCHMEKDGRLDNLLKYTGKNVFSDKS